MRYIDPAIEAAASKFPPTFGLRAYPGDTFRISLGSSYLTGPVSAPDGVMLYTERLMPDGSWCDFAKGTIADLTRNVREDPTARFCETE